VRFSFSFPSPLRGGLVVAPFRVNLRVNPGFAQGGAENVRVKPATRARFAYSDSDAIKERRNKGLSVAVIARSEVTKQSV